MITTSPEQAIKMMADPRYFIQRFFHVIAKLTNQKVPFVFNFVQQKYYKARTRYDLILKARKEGFTSLILAIWLVACLFQENTRAVVVSHEDEATKRLFAKVRFYLDTMGAAEDQKFETTLDEESKKQITFPLTNSSFWIGTAGSRAFGRGDDITHLLLSEVAHYKNQEFLTGVIAACTRTAWRVMETTANGIGEQFNLMWEQAGDPQSGSLWNNHFFGWFEDPTHSEQVPDGITFLRTVAEKRMADSIKAGTGVTISDAQILWYRQTKNSMPDQSKMVQEYPSNPREAFISSGRHVFNIGKLDEMLGKTTKPLWTGELSDDGKDVKFKDNPEGRFQIWKMPRPGRSYLISADVAKGVLDGAWSVARVWDRSSWEPVALFRARLDPGDFGEQLALMGFYFNNALLAPENNNHGWACLERLKMIGYTHILKEEELWPEDRNKQFGFPTNEKTKGLIISSVRNAIDEGTYFEYSDFCINEMMRAVWNDAGKMVTQSGWTDSIIATGIGLYCLKFLTLDETYRDSGERSPIIASRPSRRGYGRR